jgi:two-component system sensor histidine kinase HydH
VFRIERVSRWGLVAAAALMGIALLATVFAINRGVEGASDTLIRGQATTFRGALRGMTRRRPPTKAEVVELVEQLEPQGVRYIAVITSDQVIDAGELPDDADEIRAWVEADHERYTEVGSRIRITFRPPRRFADRRPSLVIDFIPVDANALRTDARRGLIIGAAVAVALLLIAIALIRYVLRQEALERKLEHRRRLASLGEMSAVLAHEIRNPIASLKGNAQLLVKMLPDGDKPRAKAERVVGEAERLERLTNDLLEFARSGAIHRTEVDPAELVREVAAQVGGDIELDCDGAPGRWSLDAARIRQVLGNLLENAVQASAGAPVTARATRVGSDLELSIRDRGDGIAAADLEQIFEPFYTRKTRGTGLGLAVARRLIEGHGGTLVARNHPEGGAEFVATIPNHD